MRVINILKNKITFLYSLLVVLAGLVTCVFSFCTAISFRLYEQNDLFDYHRENIPVLVVLSALVLLFGFYVYKKDLGKEGTWIRAALVFCAIYCLFMIGMIDGRATTDALTLDGITNQFMEGDFTELLEKGTYIGTYPFQLGYVLCGQILYVLFGRSKFAVYMLLNAAAILYTVYCLYRITKELYEDEKTARFFALLSFGLLNLYTFSTFVYNDIWSFGLQAGAMLYHLRFLKRGQTRDEGKAILLIAIAYVVKTNCLIAIIAMAMTLIMKFIEKKGGARLLVMAACVFLLSYGLRTVIFEGYRMASGAERISEGVPATAYFAMGMEEAEGKYGWYNGTNVGLYREGGWDAQKTGELAKQRMGEHLRFFKEHPKYFVEFYALKFLSQWGDPTSVSMRELELTGRHGRTNAVKESIVYGRGRDVLHIGMNVFHFLLFLLFSIEGIRLLRKRKIGEGEAFLLMFIFGGMAFHLLWEASSRYTLRYVLYLLPFAAHGMKVCFDRMTAMANRTRQGA
ncbi:MAG: glycosyltransferase family 39 protein [Lachnospiraceae bacterium]|nr:glycosyltransferase family 39 protein [Lachnospiraceae bacterium]